MVEQRTKRLQPFNYDARYDGSDYGKGILWQPNLLSPLLWVDSYTETTLTTSGESPDKLITWIDRSSNGNDLTESSVSRRPITGETKINEYNVVDFDATVDSRVVIPSGVWDITNRDNTVYVVAKRNTDSGNQMLYSLQNTSVGFRQALYYGATGQVSWISGNGQPITGSGVTTDELNILSGVFDGNTTIDLFNNSLRIQTSDTRGALNNDVDVGTVAGSTSTSSFQLTGSICEILLFDRKLNTVEKETVEGYLADKWELQDKLPLTHNYKSKAPEIGETVTGYDIVLLIGQSNMIGYEGPIDPVLDAPQANIAQWGRVGVDNNQIIVGQDPLQHNASEQRVDDIGSGMTFAKNFALTLPSNRKVLLIPAASGGTSFQAGNWNPGDAVYEDALARVIAALNERPQNRFSYILWHQGEADKGQTQSFYANALDAMINDIRSKTGYPNVPFICGSPSTLGDGFDQNITKALADTPNRISNSFYVPPTVSGDINDQSPVQLSIADQLHFDAVSLRTYGQNYWNIANT